MQHSPYLPFSMLVIDPVSALDARQRIDLHLRKRVLVGAVLQSDWQSKLSKHKKIVES